MQGQIETALKGAGKIPPKWHATLVERGTLKLADLLRDGLVVPAKFGKDRLTVKFRQIGDPFKARQRTGWIAVKVKSSFGGLTNLLWDHETDEVSGLLRLQR